MMGWEYVAGFFDGEGCVYSRKEKHLSQKYWGICITQKDRNILNKIQEFTGYGTIYQRNNQKYNWHRYEVFRQEEVLDFLRNIFPYLIVKKEHVQKILENPWKPLYNRRRLIKKIQV